MRRLEKVLDRSVGRRPSRSPRWKQLRGQIWIGHAIYLSGLTEADFASKYLRKPNGRQTDALRRWLTGKSHPERVSAVKLEADLPGTLAVFDWPIFPLLDNAELSEAKIARLMADIPQLKSPGTIVFKFQNAPPTVWFGDSTEAVARGDIWGLTLAVWAARRAEAVRDEHAHLEHCKSMYRALPKVLQTPWIAKALPLLRESLTDVRRGFYYSMAMFDVDWSVIARQAADPMFEPRRERRPKDPVTGRFLEIEDPILPAKLIRGTDVARRLKKSGRRP